MALVGLAGCPFIFGEPDLSNVSVDSAAVVTTQTGAPTTTSTTDSSTSAATTRDMPNLTSVIASPRYDHVEIAFTVDDPNGDLVGATVHVDQGDAASQYVVPVDLDVWNQFGVSRLSVPQNTPCVGYTEAWDVRMTDAAGHPSAAVPIAAAVRSAGILPAGASNLGALVTPLTACGNIETLSPKQIDEVFFTLDKPAQLTVELRWSDAETDLDLYLFRGADELAFSRGDSTLTETLVADLDPGPIYRLEVRFWNGTQTSWQLFIRTP